jgi:hypothetical protein
VKIHTSWGHESMVAPKVPWGFKQWWFDGVAVTFPPLCHQLHGVLLGNSSSTQGVFSITRVDYERVPEFKVLVRYARSNILYQGMQMNAGCPEFVLKSNQLPKWYLKGPNIWHWFESEEELLSVLHKPRFAHWFLTFVLIRLPFAVLSTSTHSTKNFAVKSPMVWHLWHCAPFPLWISYLFCSSIPSPSSLSYRLSAIAARSHWSHRDRALRKPKVIRWEGLKIWKAQGVFWTKDKRSLYKKYHLAI